MPVFKKSVGLSKFSEMNAAVILLGSNKGNRLGNLENALSLINIKAGLITQFSHIYETEPWGRTNQPVFYNQVVVTNTLLDVCDG